MSDQSSDVASTLNELERKLRALERDLQAVLAEPSPSVQLSPPVDTPSAPTSDADPEQIVAAARRQIAQLRDELAELTLPRERVSPPTTELPVAPIPQPLALEHTIQQGAVAIDAGFFRDITSLSTFEQSIARVPGVVGVHVRSFEHGRAIIDAQLSHPIALGAELARYAPLRFTVTGAGPQHLMLAISG